LWRYFPCQAFPCIACDLTSLARSVQQQIKSFLNSANQNIHCDHVTASANQKRIYISSHNPKLQRVNTGHMNDLCPSNIASGAQTGLWSMQQYLEIEFRFVLCKSRVCMRTQL
jgi:hypothetical protein